MALNCPLMTAHVCSAAGGRDRRSHHSESTRAGSRLNEGSGEGDPRLMYPLLISRYLRTRNVLYVETNGITNRDEFASPVSRERVTQLTLNSYESVCVTLHSNFFDLSYSSYIN
jgi:hypothetical protein